MTLKCLLAPSILNADFAQLGTAVAAVEKGGADMLHLDIMDGHFVPNMTIGPVVVSALQKCTRLPLDCHLMVNDPERFIEWFADAGASSITVHVESTHHIDSLLRRIRQRGCRVGVSLNPGTSIDSLDHVLPLTDMVLLMSVNPGFGGQSFIPTTLDKLRQCRKIIDDSGLDIRLEIDGGVKVDNIAEIKAAGADTFVSGSGIFGKGQESDPHRYDTIVGQMKAELGKI